MGPGPVRRRELARNSARAEFVVAQCRITLFKQSFVTQFASAAEAVRVET